MADEELEEGGGGKKKLIIIIVAVLLLLGVAGVGAWFFLSGGEEPEETTPAEQTQEQTIQQTDEGIEKGFLENPVITEPFTSTVGTRDGKKFVRFSLRLGLVSEEANAYLTTRIPIATDTIITTIQNKTSRELESNTNLLKRDLIRKLNTRIFTEKYVQESEDKDRTPIKEVLFEEFILQ